MESKIVDDSGELLCPECGFDYNHIKCVSFDREGGYNPGTSKVLIRLECEEGHIWVLELYEYKGRIEVKRQLLGCIAV